MLRCCLSFKMPLFPVVSSFASRRCYLAVTPFSSFVASISPRCSLNYSVYQNRVSSQRIYPFGSYSSFTVIPKISLVRDSQKLNAPAANQWTEQFALQHRNFLFLPLLCSAPQLHTFGGAFFRYRPHHGKKYQLSDILKEIDFTQKLASQESFFSPVVIFLALFGSFCLCNGTGLCNACLADTGFTTAAPDDPSNTNTTALPEVQAGIFVEGLPEYTPEQVTEHKSTESRVWITYKRGVYDITDFIELHPGGTSRISLAAGASIDPFWALYAQHHTNEVYEILEEMRIGNLIESTMKEIVAPNDPFKNEPRRHPALKVVSAKPFNAETPLQILSDNFITPNALFFVRNHLPIPKVNLETYRLSIQGLGIEKEIYLTLDEIRSLFKKHSVTATIQCAGNRRNSFGKIRPVKGLNWSTGAISTAVWSGALLKDILTHFGISAQTVDTLDIEHIHFEGLDCDMEKKNYGASIPISSVMSKDGEVILAYEMNGEPLPIDHGFPLRAIVPGVVGARNVKWLKTIVVSSDESPSFWQQHDYRSFSPSIDWSTVDWRRAPSIQEYPVQSGICFPSDGECIEKEEEILTVKGYAWSGGGRAIIRVEISFDEGKTWHEAKLRSKDTRIHREPSSETTKDSLSTESNNSINEKDISDFEEITDWGKRRVDRAWAWALWHVEIPIPEALRGQTTKIHCRAVDASYNTQPESAASIWNLRGCLCNCWHNISVSFL